MHYNILIYTQIDLHYHVACCASLKHKLELKNKRKFSRIVSKRNNKVVWIEIVLRVVIKIVVVAITQKSSGSRCYNSCRSKRNRIIRCISNSNRRSRTIGSKKHSRDAELVVSVQILIGLKLVLVVDTF